MSPISFDLWDTLLWHPAGPNPARDDRAALVARLTGRDPADAAAALRGPGLPLDQSEALDLTLATQLGRALAGLEPPADAVARCAEGFGRLAARYPPVATPGARGALARVAEREQVALVSNTRWTPGAVLGHVLDHEGLAARFGAIAFSDETGWAKPAAGAFAAAWDALGVDPATTVHVGDRVARDVAGAHRAGAKAVLCRAVRWAREDDDASADGVIHDFAGLDAILAHVRDRAIEGWETVADGVPVVGPPVVARASWPEIVGELRAGRVALLGDGASAQGLWAASPAAIVTETGGPRSVAAEFAGSSGTPCVADAGELRGRVSEGDLVLVDGGTGRIHAPVDRLT